MPPSTFFTWVQETTFAGVPLWKAMLMAGIGGVSFVVEGLARAFMDDGKLTVDEINDVFNRVEKKAK